MLYVIKYFLPLVTCGIGWYFHLLHCPTSGALCSTALIFELCKSAGRSGWSHTQTEVCAAHFRIFLFLKTWQECFREKLKLRSFMNKPKESYSYINPSKKCSRAFDCYKMFSGSHLKVCQGVCDLCFNLVTLKSKCFQQLLTVKEHLECCTRSRCCRIKILKLFQKLKYVRIFKIYNQRL